MSVGALGCRPEREGQAQAASEARARETAKAVASGAAERRDGESVLKAEQREVVAARVGERAITLGDVERELQAMPAFVRARYGTHDRKIELLHTLVQFEVLAAEAQRKGLDKDPDVMQAAKLAMVEKYLSEDVAQLVKASSVSEEELARAYENRRSEFVRPEMVRVSSIRIKEKAAAEAVLSQLRAAIEGDKEKARAIFGDFVRRHTTDMASFNRNGDLGFVGRDGYIEGSSGAVRLDTAAVAAAFDLAGPGVVSDVVPMGDEFAILQTTTRRPALTRTLNDTRVALTSMLLRDKQERARRDFIDGLRAKAQVTIDEGVLAQIDVSLVRTVPGASKAVTQVLDAPPPGIAQPEAPPTTLPPALVVPAAENPAPAPPAAGATEGSAQVEPAAGTLLVKPIRSRDLMGPGERVKLVRPGAPGLTESDRKRLQLQNGVNP